MTPLTSEVVQALAQHAAESPAHLDPVLVQQVCREWETNRLAAANLYALCRRMVRQKTNLQRDVLMCHATRIASEAGVETGVSAMLRARETT